MYCSPWGREEWDTTEQLNNNSLVHVLSSQMVFKTFYWKVISNSETPWTAAHQTFLSSLVCFFFFLARTESRPRLHVAFGCHVCKHLYRPGFKFFSNCCNMSSFSDLNRPICCTCCCIRGRSPRRLPHHHKFMVSRSKLLRVPCMSHMGACNTSQVAPLVNHLLFFHLAFLHHVEGPFRFLQEDSAQSHWGSGLLQSHKSTSPFQSPAICRGPVLEPAAVRGAVTLTPSPQGTTGFWPCHGQLGFNHWQ